MIKSDIFYTSFEDALVNSFPDIKEFKIRRSKQPKFAIPILNHALVIAFKVNPKASAIPYCPGEFWPDIVWNGEKYKDRDDGSVSWYQYTTDKEHVEYMELQHFVINKTVTQQITEEFYKSMRDLSVKSKAPLIEQGFKPNWPNSGLIYLDQEDASSWGNTFGKHLPFWIEKFKMHPETLESYMWRVVWEKTK